MLSTMWESLYAAEYVGVLDEDIFLIVILHIWVCMFSDEITHIEDIMMFFLLLLKTRYLPG